MCDNEANQFDQKKKLDLINYMLISKTINKHNI
jgi:hypothetical protein